MTTRRPGDFRTGVAIPILRSLAIIAVMAIVAKLVALLLEDIRWFYGLFIAGLIAIRLMDSYIRPHKDLERAASRRWFGLDDAH